MSRPTSLQEEIQQSKPFVSKSQEAMLSLFRTSDMLRRFTTGCFVEFGITSQQYNVLRILRGAGSEGLPTLSIGDRMVEHAPGVTRLIDRLTAKNLVRRERVAGDRRRVQCFITASGLELLASLDEPVNEVDARALSMLDTSEQESLIELLSKIRQGLRALDPET